MSGKRGRMNLSEVADITEDDDRYSEEEATRARDDALMRMLQTPPKRHKDESPKRERREPPRGYGFCLTPLNQ